MTNVGQSNDKCRSIVNSIGSGKENSNHISQEQSDLSNNDEVSMELHQTRRKPSNQIRFINSDLEYSFASSARSPCLGRNM